METEKTIQRKLADFYHKTRAIIPNISWGFDLPYEVDLLMVGKTGVVEEIEIKVNLQDLKKDAEKIKHAYLQNGKVQKFWYAMPLDIWLRYLKTDWKIPEYAGVIIVDQNRPIGFQISVERKPKRISQWRLDDGAQWYKLLRNMSLKYWSHHESGTT